MSDHVSVELLVYTHLGRLQYYVPTLFQSPLLSRLSRSAQLFPQLNVSN